MVSNSLSGYLPFKTNAGNFKAYYFYILSTVYTRYSSFKEEHIAWIIDITSQPPPVSLFAFLLPVFHSPLSSFPPAFHYMGRLIKQAPLSTWEPASMGLTTTVRKTAALDPISFQPVAAQLTWSFYHLPEHHDLRQNCYR